MKKFYLVKTMSTGAPNHERRLTFSKRYHKYIIIIDSKKTIEEVSEIHRGQIEDAMQSINPNCKVVTKIVSLEKLNIEDVLIYNDKE